MTPQSAHLLVGHSPPVPKASTCILLACVINHRCLRSHDCRLDRVAEATRQARCSTDPAWGAALIERAMKEAAT